MLQCKDFHISVLFCPATKHTFVTIDSYYSIFSNLLLLNLLTPTGYVIHQQFDIQQLYALPTLHLCALYLSENKQRPVPLTA